MYAPRDIEEDKFQSLALKDRAAERPASAGAQSD
jgi:hypothetical protein